MLLGTNNILIYFLFLNLNNNTLVDTNDFPFDGIYRHKFYNY